jgi:hypothetical protein
LAWVFPNSLKIFCWWPIISLRVSATAERKRETSAFTASGGTCQRPTARSMSSKRNALPMAIPGEAEIPLNTRVSAAGRFISFLVGLIGEKLVMLSMTPCSSALRPPPSICRSVLRREGQDAHDAFPVDFLVVLAEPDLAVEFLQGGAPAWPPAARARPILF